MAVFKLAKRFRFPQEILMFDGERPAISRIASPEPTSLF
jgi:hypothetical protein